MHTAQLSYTRGGAQSQFLEQKRRTRLAPRLLLREASGRKAWPTAPAFRGGNRPPQTTCLMGAGSVFGPPCLTFSIAISCKPSAVWNQESASSSEQIADS